ncbi:MAG TPA: ATP-grasp domain-containing protein, partial [Bryobacteraceae bacterium]|nr:ATP-grasp domain-containing protein [Bryobacteraceae bacterium]
MEQIERHVKVEASGKTAGAAFPLSSSIVQMKIHEYQAKSILAKYNVPVPRGEAASSVAEAGAIAKKLG